VPGSGRRKPLQSETIHGSAYGDRVDLAKHVFQLHGVNEAGVVVLRRRLRRSQVETFFAALPACTVAMEACPSAHHWARCLASQGHAIRLVPPKYVKPFMKRNKNDAADAEAIVEAALRPNMRFVPVKSESQQALLMLHRARSLLTRQETSVICAIRGYFAEFGIVEATGAHRVQRLIALLDGHDPGVPELARDVLKLLAAQLAALQGRLKEIDAAGSALSPGRTRPVVGSRRSPASVR
jgi:transposase